MRKQGLSRRERNMVEEAVTQVCWAMGVSPEKSLRLAACIPIPGRWPDQLLTWTRIPTDG